MNKLVVIGGGIAGSSAAIEAIGRGMSVALVEKGKIVPPPKSLWPDLIDGKIKLSEMESISNSMFSKLSSSRLILGEEVRGILSDAKKVITNSSRINYDRLILASGSSPSNVVLKGSDKKGCYIMKDLESFVSLSDEIGNLSVVAISGSGPLPLVIADKLLRICDKVTLFNMSNTLGSKVSEPILLLLEHVLRDKGAEVVKEGVSGALGNGKVEAVLSNGEVFPAEALIYVPNYLPNTLGLEVESGRAGGVLVNSKMNTSNPSIYAAGDCAELRLYGSSISIMLESAAKIMGKVAGINASGGSSLARLSATVFLNLFGIELVYSGLSKDEAKRVGLDAEEATMRFSRKRSELICTIVYDRRSHYIYGIQLIGEHASSSASSISIAISNKLRLEDLAFQDYPSFHTSSAEYISETATMALGEANYEGTSN